MYRVEGLGFRVQGLRFRVLECSIMPYSGFYSTTRSLAFHHTLITYKIR